MIRDFECTRGHKRTPEITYLGKDVDTVACVDEKTKESINVASIGRQHLRKTAIMNATMS